MFKTYDFYLRVIVFLQVFQSFIKTGPLNVKKIRPFGLSLTLKNA